MAGEEVGVGNVYNSFKKYEEKQENRKTKAKGDGVRVVMRSRTGNLKKFEGYRVHKVPKVVRRDGDKSTHRLSKVRRGTPFPLKRNRWREKTE